MFFSLEWAAVVAPVPRHYEIDLSGRISYILQLQRRLRAACGVLKCLDTAGVGGSTPRDFHSSFRQRAPEDLCFYVDTNSNYVSILINHDPRPSAGVAAKALLSNPIN
jgi:hypothetical protein